MWKKSAAFFALSAFSFSLIAQDLVPITLVDPNLKRETTLMQALSERKSTREFNQTQLNDQDLSDLLWAANGINRKDKQGRTAPSAMNSQEIAIYVIRAEGVYLYDAVKHVLNPIQKGDFRKHIANQNFVETAPVNLILVADLSRFKHGDNNQKKLWAAFDAGIVSQNISIFCSAAKLATVPRAMINTEKMNAALKLKNTQLIQLNHPIGYFKGF